MYMASDKLEELKHRHCLLHGSVMLMISIKIVKDSGK